MAHAGIVPLNTKQYIDETEIGPKAMSLVRMNRAGCQPVGQGHPPRPACRNPVSPLHQMPGGAGIDKG